MIPAAYPCPTCHTPSNVISRKLVKPSGRRFVRECLNRHQFVTFKPRRKPEEFKVMLEETVIEAEIEHAPGWNGCNCTCPQWRHCREDKPRFLPCEIFIYFEEMEEVDTGGLTVWPSVMAKIGVDEQG